MSRKYYSSRRRHKKITIDELHSKVVSAYLYFEDKDFFKEKTGISNSYCPDSIKHKAAIFLNFQPFPIKKWSYVDVSEDNIFDFIEFLFDHVSEPSELTPMVSDSGYHYYDYVHYDEKSGQDKFREMINPILCSYRDGYEINSDGEIWSLGIDGLQYILDAEIPEYDKENVDDKVRWALSKWRNRQLSIEERREAVRSLIDVFEWLKKSGKLKTALNNKDDHALFELANNFHLRHHNKDQKSTYDASIWLSWMFHYYLATYHATIRILLKETKG